MVVVKFHAGQVELSGFGQNITHVFLAESVTADVRVVALGRLRCVLAPRFAIRLVRALAVRTRAAQRDESRNADDAFRRRLREREESRAG